MSGRMATLRTLKVDKVTAAAKRQARDTGNLFNYLADLISDREFLLLDFQDSV